MREAKETMSHMLPTNMQIQHACSGVQVHHTDRKMLKSKNSALYLRAMDTLAVLNPAKEL